MGQQITPLLSEQKLESHQARTISFLADQRRWLALEEMAEIHRIQKESGHFRRLGSLLLSSLEDWHSGRQLAKFIAPKSQNTKFLLYQKMFDAGDSIKILPLGLHEKSDSQSSGIIHEIWGNGLSVVVPRAWTPEENQPFRLEPASNGWTMQRTDQILQTLSAQIGSKTVDDLPPAIRLIVGRSIAKLPEPLEWINSPLLNEGQNLVLSKVLKCPPLGMIQGPPGTGKTTTVSALIAFLVRSGQRVLVASASNLAVDNLLEKVMEKGVSCLRMGHPARVHSHAREATFDQMLKSSPEYTHAKKLRQEARAIKSKAGKWSRAKPEPGQRKNQFNEARDLFTEADRFEEIAREKLLDDTPAIFTTLSSFVQSWPGNRFWDWLVIDEACQAMEAPVWPLLRKANNVVLAGDPKQLPPTVICRQAAAEGASVSLMERLAKELPERLFFLETQYRMAPEIMAFPSVDSYGGKLKAHTSVLERVPNISENGLFSHKVLAIDTSGSDFFEEPGEEGESRINLSEARLITLLANQFISQGLERSQIGIITPYRAQVELLTSKPDLDGIEINSVDSFQGREKDVIMVSFVRSNPNGDIGFLEETRRTHVAITRAKRHLTVVGDFSTLASNPYYSRLLDFWLEKGFVRSVWDEDISHFLA